MIGTHAPKMFNPRLRQPGFSARIIAPEADVVSSATVKLRRQVFACPLNAADMPQAKATAAEALRGWSSDAQLPAIRDPQLKQLIVPSGDWRADEYLAVSPVASMGLAHELFHRLREKRAPYAKWLVQPIAAALANHGEALMLQSGYMRLMRRGQSRPEASSVWRGERPIAMLRCRVQRMNISGGMICVGWPAITAIGGLVHALERKTGCELRFAIGAEGVEWVAGARHTVNRGTPLGPSDGVRVGKVRGKTAIPTPGYMRDEIEANGWVTLLLDGAEDPASLSPALLGLTRLAGGSLFDTTFHVVQPGQSVGQASFLIDASAELRRRPQPVDALDAALEAYMRNGEWDDEGLWRQTDNGYGLNMTGYAPLELAQLRRGTRGNYPHAWAEPVFSLVTQGPLTPMGWWQLQQGACGVRWKAIQ